MRRHSPPTACRQTGSGSLSLPSPGFFSPFPHGTGPLSVAREYLALEGGPPSFPQGCSCPVVLGFAGQRVECAFVYRALTVSGGRFHGLRLTPRLATLRAAPHRRPTTPDRVAPIRFGLLPVRSPLLGESLLMSFPRGTEMFQFPRFASPPYEFRERSVGITPRGFPHSGIRGSRPACGSPRLFAACHALRRFLAPRHPPSALPCLTTDAFLRGPPNDFSCRRSGYSSFSYAVVKELRAGPEAGAKKCHWLARVGDRPSRSGSGSPHPPISLERR